MRAAEFHRAVTVNADVEPVVTLDLDGAIAPEPRRIPDLRLRVPESLLQKLV